MLKKRISTPQCISNQTKTIEAHVLYISSKCSKKNHDKMIKAWEMRKKSPWRIYFRFSLSEEFFFLEMFSTSPGSSTSLHRITLLPTDLIQYVFFSMTKTENSIKLIALLHYFIARWKTEIKKMLLVYNENQKVKTKAYEN